MKKNDFIKAFAFMVIIMIFTDLFAWFRRGKTVYYDPDFFSNPFMLVSGLLLFTGFLFLVAWLFSVQRRRRRRRKD